jgi:RNA polymerase sigma factor (sigma-70 family)
MTAVCIENDDTLFLQLVEIAQIADEIAEAEEPINNPSPESYAEQGITKNKIQFADNAGIQPYQLDQESLFRDLIAQHQKRLYRFVIKYIDHPDDAADITQQAFVEAARTIANFRGDSKLSTWLFGIAMNMVRNYLSRAPHRVWKFETDEVLTGVASAWPDPSECMVQKEMLEMAEKAFSDLPEEMSQVLGLVAIDEISYQDAADILCIPLGTVRSRVSRARAVLRAHFLQAGVPLHF